MLNKYKYKKLIFYLIIIITMFFGFSDMYKINGQSEYDEIIENYIESYGMEGYNLCSKEYAYDLSGNSYIIQNLNPSGYMILDSQTLVLVEASFSSCNPYYVYDSSVKKIYIGPLNYFVILDDGIFDICNECYVLDSSNLEKLSSNFNDMINNVYTENDITPLSYEIDNNGYRVIEYHEYFRNLNQFPENMNGTCGYVALSMLLGYYDMFHNSYTLPNQDSSYSNISPNKILEFETSFPEYPKYNMWKSMFGGTTNYLHNILFNYEDSILDEFVDGYPLTGGMMENVFNKYAEDYIPTEYRNSYVTRTGADYDGNDYDFIKNQIDNSNPIIAVYVLANYTPTITTEGTTATLSTDDSTISNKYHDIVIYGYSGSTYLAHFGWEDKEETIDGVKYITNYKEVYVNINLIHSSFTIEYTGEHIHNDSLKWKLGEEEGAFCPCGYVYCDHEFSEVLSEKMHIYECNICNFYEEEYHTYQLIDNLYVCNECEYNTVNCAHNYIYLENYNTQTHNVMCTMCGFEGNVYHTLKNLKGKYYCTMCPFTCEQDLIIPTLPTYALKKEED